MAHHEHSHEKEINNDFALATKKDSKSEHISSHTDTLFKYGTQVP